MILFQNAFSNESNLCKNNIIQQLGENQNELLRTSPFEMKEHSLIPAICWKKIPAFELLPSSKAPTQSTPTPTPASTLTAILVTISQAIQIPNFNSIGNLIIIMPRSESQISQPELSTAGQIRQSILAVSQSQRYQKRILIYFLLVAFFANLLVSGAGFLYMNPVFQCDNTQGKVSEELACENLNFCHIINTSTITAELELYCDDRKDARTLIQIASGVGNWLGILFAGTISDKKGRKLCFCVGILMLNLTCVFQYLGVHFQNILLLIVSQFIGGSCEKVLYLNFLVLLTRFLTKDLYEKGTMGWFIAGYGMSLVAIAGVNEYFNDWRILFYIYFFGLLLCTVGAFYILQEDPIYLFDSGKLKEAKRVIEAIGEENGVSFKDNQANLKSIDRIFEAKMLHIESDTIGKNKNEFDPREMLRCDIVTKIIIIGIVGCFYAITSKSIEFSLQNLEFSYNINLLIVAVANVTGFLTAIYICKREPKKKRGLLLTSVLNGVIALLLAFPFCYSNGTIESFVIFFFKFFLCWLCNFYVRLKVDSFPEKYQLTAMGTVEFLANIGNVIGPIFVRMSFDYGVNPIFSVTLFRLTLGTLPILFLVEQKSSLKAPKESQFLSSPDGETKEISN